MSALEEVEYCQFNLIFLNEMIREYTILHISDLHKPKKASYDNLFASLCSDCEKYTATGVPKPSIIVVSGDLVEGSKETDIAKAESEIAAQYQEVADFLKKLVGYFLDNDKERIIIVPGNHDVCWALSVASMQKESVDNEDEIKEKRLQINENEIRWSWKDLSFYSIKDIDIYKRRFDLFLEFYNSFYQGEHFSRIWPDPCEDNLQIIDLPAYNICFLGLNSCYKLDHLNDSGSICPSALTGCQAKLSNISKRGSLVVGVWHHHTTGLPYENNYLDYRILQAMIDAKVQIGLYGHQHLTSVLNEYHDLTKKERILLISSGSLYGSRNQLATGYPRQYGLISLKFQEKGVCISLRVRKDRMSYEIPSWCESQIGTSALTEYEEFLELPPIKPEYFIHQVNDYVQRTNDYKSGYKLMMGFVDLSKDMVLKFSDTYLNHITDNDFILANIVNPETDMQYQTLLRAAIEMKNKSTLIRLKMDDRYDKIKGSLMNYLKEEVEKILSI